MLHGWAQSGSEIAQVGAHLSPRLLARACRALPPASHRRRVLPVARRPRRVQPYGFLRRKHTLLTRAGAQVAGQDGARLKKASLAKKLKDELGCSIVCADAPHLLPASTTVTIDGTQVTLDELAPAGKEERVWFFYSEDDPRDCVLEGCPHRPGFLADADRRYPGWEQSVQHLAEVWEREGPFDGVLGFSQGAAMAHILCWLGERGRAEGGASDRRQPARPWSELRFAIFCAGFPSRLAEQREDAAAAAGTGASLLALPSLHMSGRHDINVPPEHQRALHAQFACSAVEPVWEHDHTRGHVLPQTAADRSRVIEFVRRFKLP